MWLLHLDNTDLEKKEYKKIKIMRRVVVTGIGMVSPLGSNNNQIFKLIDHYNNVNLTFKNKIHRKRY